MATRFQLKTGAASADPNPIMRWLSSTVVTQIVRPERMEKRRASYERSRRRAGRPHVVEYFHQVEDGYSHLAAQVLEPLTRRYDIELVCHLVLGPQGRNSAEPDLLLRLSRTDAHQIASHYGLTFPEHRAAPAPLLLAQATAILAAQNSSGFIHHAPAVGNALWTDNAKGMAELAIRHGQTTETETLARRSAGTRRRKQLGHYSGAMFYFGREWYWGIDRLYHLEQRLTALGLDRHPEQVPLSKRPAATADDLADDGRLTFELFMSLRSPYTAIGFDRAVALARSTGVRLVVRPVLPMVMRGVPATREKGLYIFSDAAREARAAGVPFGNFYDPIGKPVCRCYSLYPWACEQGRGVELLSCFLQAAFTRGINTNTDKGLRWVVQQAGLDWHQAQRHINQPGWEDRLEQNRLAMHALGLWGVPSFRLIDEHGTTVLALWGQDRLWLFDQAIQRQLAHRQQQLT